MHKSEASLSEKIREKRPGARFVKKSLTLGITLIVRG